MGEFDLFINKIADKRLAQYTKSRQKKIAGLFKKTIFRIVTTTDISTNVQIFKSRFVAKVKKANPDKTYEKSWLVVPAYNN